MPEDFVVEDRWVAVHALVLSSMTEHIRCVRLATGQIVYEFTAAGGDGRIARIDAGTYHRALDEAREGIQDERGPDRVHVVKAERRSPDA